MMYTLILEPDTYMFLCPMSSHPSHPYPSIKVLSDDLVHVIFLLSFLLQGQSHPILHSYYHPGIYSMVLGPYVDIFSDGGRIVLPVFTLLYPSLFG